jgi:cell division protein FtsL
MTILLSILLVLSLIGNGIFIWYTRKLVQNLYYGVNNVDEMQKLLNEYADLLEPLATLENYYGEPAITSAIANTKLVMEACKTYKNSIIESDNEENQEAESTKESQEAKANQSIPQKDVKTASIGA